ncbi:MAG: ADP-glyceromanno-heptose 6-epimerase [Flavobacteriales bacterium]|nr:ADP-glyceromanno-heptose 6-epimerase [Flavobacteriales bacterium]
MILITGAAGFIGSYLVGKFNSHKLDDLLLCDDFRPLQKRANWSTKRYIALLPRDTLFDDLKAYEGKIDTVIHLGARTNTTIPSFEEFEFYNLRFSQKLWKYCSERQITFIYASSAATYGDGSAGYSDRVHPDCLQPLNSYARSKNEFDRWALAQDKWPAYWVGLKFFNVFGPNEYHKGRMASVVYHGFCQIRDTGRMRLFRSHRPDIPDGHQRRDFIYVDDVAEIIWFLLKRQPVEGLLNVGTGRARTFLEVAHSLFSALELPVQIEWVDTPPDIRNAYQYVTEADLSKFCDIGYPKPFKTLEEGIQEYVRNYLIPGRYY